MALIYSENPKASFDYEILDKYEAGMELTGPEAKSIKTNGISLKAAYVRIMSDGSVLLINSHISKYKPAFSAQMHYDPERSRNLLLHKREVVKLFGKVKERGLTIIPLKVYLKGKFIKIEIGLAKGKKLYDKRESIKKRDVERDMKRELRGKL